VHSTVTKISTTSVNNIAGTGKTLATNTYGHSKTPATNTFVPAKTPATNTYVPAKTTATNTFGLAKGSVNNNPGPSAPAASNATTNTSGTMRGGSHVVGDVTLFVPRKSRTTGVKRSIDEVGNVGTQQSVNKS